jgi:hypothetical protein
MAVMRNQTALLPAILPALLADVAGLIAMFVLFPPLAERLTEPGGLNALLLSGGFVVFCLGVFWLRRLRPVGDDDGEWAARHWRMALAVLFALVMSLAIAWQLGFFRSGLQVDTRELGEGGSASYFVFGPGAWLGFSALYVLVLGFTVRPSVEPGSGRWSVAATLGLLAANAMLLLLSAQARAFTGEAALWLPLLYAGLLLLFLPPRLVYIARGPGFPSPAGYVTLGLFLMLVGAYALAIVTR